MDVIHPARLDLLIAPFFAAAGLVIVSGTAKLRHPTPARRALGAVGLPSGPGAVRAIGVVETGIGLWCLFAPGRVSALSLAILYTGFAAFVVVLMTAGPPVASCGCLGTEDSPPSLALIALDLAAATTATLVALAPPPAILPFAARLPLGGAPFLLGTALIAYLASLVVAHLPRAFWSYGRSAAGPLRNEPPQRFALRPRGDR